MNSLPTVKVKRDGPKGFRLINASDFDAARHELFDAPAAPAPEDESLRAVKGPRGKWYVKRGRGTVAGPFETEREALFDISGG